jgi:hypothetical protein
MTWTQQRKLVAFLLAAIFPLSAVCADMRGAMLYVSKTGTVNGTEFARSTAIFTNDTVQLPAGSSGSITMAGSSVVIAPGSTVTYHSDVIELSNVSGVAVNTANGAAVKTNKLTIAPAHSSGKYAVACADGAVLVAAKSGAVKIFDGNSTSIIAEGTTASVTDPQTPGATPAAREQGLSKAAAILIMLGVAGAAILIALLTTGPPPVSPHRP